MRFNPFAHRSRYRPQTPRPRYNVSVGRILLRLLVLSLMAAILGCITTGCVLLYKFMYDSQYFKVRDVILTGADADLAVKNQIERRIQQDKFNEANLLNVQEKTVQNAVQQNAKVKQALVAKQYPNRLLIGVTLRHAVALVLHDPILAIDGEGYVLESLDVRHPSVLELPFITGLDKKSLSIGSQIQSEALTKALLLLSCLENRAPALFAKTSEVHCDEKESLTLLLKGGTEIRFGNGNPIEKMPAFDTFVQKNGTPEQFAYIDLRFEGQIPYMTRPTVKAPQVALPK
jgi:cell division septal protein FtsQ